MTWQTGTTDNYLTALQALIDVCTSDHVSAVVIDGGGAGYVVGDVLTVAGGTSTYAATLEVTSVAGGVIDGIRVKTGGAYTVDPTLSANAVTGGTGAGATMDLTMAATGWTIDRRDYRAGPATIAAGGSGYSVGNILTVVGGTSTETAQYIVTSVSGGAVTGVSPVIPSTTTTTRASGHYSVAPSNPVSTTGGAGTCTLNITFDQELIMEGDGGGGDDITIGIKTYQDTDTTGFNTTFNWALFAMTSYSSSFDLFEQLNLSPGFTASPAAEPELNTTTGAYVPLRDTDGSWPISFWFNITPYRIIAVFKVQGSTTTIYASMYLGYLNGLGTISELAYPAYVAGCSHRRNVWYADATPYITGLTSMDGGGLDQGPGFFFRPTTSAWAGAMNSDVNDGGTGRTASDDCCIYPGGDPELKPPASGFADIVTDGWSAWNGAIPDTNVPGTASWNVYPTPNTAGDLYWLVPATLIDSDASPGAYLPYGELDEVFWVGRGGVLTSEDTITVGDHVYRIFNNGNRLEEWSYMAIRETI